MAVIRAIPGVFDLHAKRMDRAVVGGRNELQRVLAADELRDFVVRADESFGVLREIGVAARGLCQLPQDIVVTLHCRKNAIL